MSSTPRYARQISVPGVGEAGQRAFRAARASITGRGLDAEVCVRYLAGAGLGRLDVDPSLVATAVAANGEVDVRALSTEGADGGEGDGEGPGGCLRVSLLGVDVDAGGADVPMPEAVLADAPDPVSRGSAAARWVLASLLARDAR